jgi:hypothetical protein
MPDVLLTLIDILARLKSWAFPPRFVKKYYLCGMNIKDKWATVNSRSDVVALRKHITESFGDLEFNEKEHRYFLDGVEMEPVTTVCHRFKKEFDKHEMSKQCYEKYFNNPSSKYFRMTQKQIMEQWDSISSQACDFGTEKHSFAEDMFYLATGETEKIKGELTEEDNLIPTNQGEENVVTFFNDLPVKYIPILCETRGYLKEKRIAGTFDLLFAYDNGEKLSRNLLLMDWKTNKNLFNQFKQEMMLTPFGDFPADNFHIYTVQLSIYQLFLEAVHCRVIDRRLLYLRGNNYSMHKLQDVTGKLKTAL